MNEQKHVDDSYHRNNIQDGLTENSKSQKIEPPNTQDFKQLTNRKISDTPKMNTKSIQPVQPHSDSKLMGKPRIMKNLLIICCGFLLLFTSFQALANLQSTINSEEGLGVASQSVIYGALIISSLFLPKMIIKKLGCKWTLVLSILTYSPYIAANFFPHMGTFVPTAILLGLGAAPLWAAKCTYLNQIGYLYASYVSDSVDVIISRFFGIFFMIFQNTQIWGNLISYYVLKPENTTEYVVSNKTLAMCGISFCNEANDSNETNPNLLPPTDEKRFMLIAIYLSCSILAAIIVAIFLDPLKSEKILDEDDESLFSKAVATLKHLRKPNQLLLIPLTIFSGLEQAFFLGDFTRAYIACAWGVHHVGFVFICFGVVNAVMSFVSGRVLKYIPRCPIMLLATAGNVATCIGLFLWPPNPEQSYIFFVLAGVWGFSDAIWQTQVNALYGILFKSNEEAGFSNYRLWESLGFTISFAYSKFLCIAAKAYILLGFLIVGMVGYLIVELRTSTKKDKYSFKSES